MLSSEVKDPLGLRLIVVELASSENPGILHLESKNLRAGVDESKVVVVGVEHVIWTPEGHVAEFDTKLTNGRIVGSWLGSALNS